MIQYIGRVYRSEGVEGIRRVSLGPVIEAIATHAPLLATGEFATFANKVHLEVGE